MGVSEADPALYVLAFDHRSVLRQMFGDRGHGQMANLKEIVLDGLLLARRREPLLSSGAAILIDEEYGAAVIGEAHAAGVTVAMPIERSGAECFTLDFGSSWRRHLEAFPVDIAKILVFLNPEADSEEYRSQLDSMAQVLGAVREHGLRSMLELLVPPTEAQLRASEGSRARFDAELRRPLVERVVADCYSHGMQPELWKLEGLESSADCESVAETVRGFDPAARILLLGRGADAGKVEDWLRLAAPVEGFSGFAIGRSIWDQALGDHLEGRIDRDAAVESVAERYVHFVRIYAQAGGLAVEQAR